MSCAPGWPASLTLKRKFEALIAAVFAGWPLSRRDPGFAGPPARQAPSHDAGRPGQAGPRRRNEEGCAGNLGEDRTGVTNDPMAANKALIAPQSSGENRVAAHGRRKRNTDVMRLAIFAIVLTGLAATSARAEYSLCNKTSYALNAAIAYAKGDVIETRGWWPLRPGQCRIVLTDQIRAGDYYIYGEAIEGHRGNQRVWTGETPLCVREEGFFTLENRGPCDGVGQKRLPFKVAKVTDGAGGQWRTDFTDLEEYSNLHRAETAGVQRLLSDIGYDIGAIDGYMGQKTRVALADFKRANNLADPATINDEVIDALIAAANAREENLGLYFCNRHEAPIWAALAEPGEDEGDPAVSRGWWRLNPDQCAKIKKGEIPTADYFVYASAESASGDAPMIGGDANFCVNDVMFEIPAGAPCEEDGYQEASFKKIDAGGKDRFTYEFTRADFAPEG